MMRSAKERNEIRRRFRVLRAHVGISQLDAALAAGILYGRYLQIERGYTLPTERERNAIARALRVTPEDVSPEVEREAVSA